MTDNTDRILRLADPDDRKPLPPAGQENLLPGALFAASAGAVVVLAVLRLRSPGASFAVPALGAAVYLGMLARGAFLVRPREGGERRCRRLMLGVQLQALLVAASTYYATSAAFRGEDPGRTAVAIFGFTVIATFAGLAASFILHGVARRARPLVLGQFLGPIFMMIGSSAGSMFG